MEDKKNNTDFNSIGEQIELSKIKMQKIGECCIESMEGLRIFGEQLQEVLDPVSIEFKLISKKISETISKIDFEKLNNNQKKLAKKMIKNGWYFSLRLPLAIGELLEMNQKDLNSSLSTFFEKETNRICDNAISMFPNRKIILEKCFKAHKNGDYELSIPVMFAQADGISNDIFNMNFFSKDRYNGNLLTSQQKEIIFDVDSFIDIPFLLQLSITGELNGSGRKSRYLNRNNVLHGTDTNYATKSNGLRCISMLNFLMELKENYIIENK
ncbi:hypothetical protein [Clostridium sporogenes]|uniref:hypothetical protein n=1 Tax=Clostridium sporogenes TaxID=1509 RepID=UPI0007175892|nr:hypothetical protein [Clostridium sporogenes]KRU40610.1 hypothetical protein VT94_22780 [Clostridium sporogenes]MBY7066495.1 hypothetical protein [Clostridium sporogenes]MBY7069185.1 hypothetical protein [Clostridium sporogenes]NFQ01683.1 hypothetical protein [Clostridium sporogenes]NFQ42723.1 hypothetical protein [Clostridium sporogenes]